MKTSIKVIIGLVAFLITLGTSIFLSAYFENWWILGAYGILIFLGLLIAGIVYIFIIRKRVEEKPVEFDFEQMRAEFKKKLITEKGDKVTDGDITQYGTRNIKGVTLMFMRADGYEEDNWCWVVNPKDKEKQQHFAKVASIEQLDKIMDSMAGVRQIEILEGIDSPFGEKKYKKTTKPYDDIQKEQQEKHEESIETLDDLDEEKKNV